MTQTSPEALLVFAATEFMLSLTPGPAVMVVVSQGMRHGFAASARGTAGILAGNAIYFALSALGLGALLLASATLFAVLKWAGVAYLVVVGLKMLLAKGEAADEAGDGAAQPPAPRRSLRLFSQGLLTQLSNPKALVFFTALLPQFVSPEGRVFEQFLLLGLVSVTVECPVLLAYGWLAERGQRLIPQGLSTLPDRIAGAFLVGAGLGLAAWRR